jgi:hypothetical protein
VDGLPAVGTLPPGHWHVLSLCQTAPSGLSQWQPVAPAPSVVEPATQAMQLGGAPSAEKKSRAHKQVMPLSTVFRGQERALVQTLVLASHVLERQSSPSSHTSPSMPRQRPARSSWLTEHSQRLVSWVLFGAGGGYVCQ